MAFEVEIYGRNLDITERIQGYVEKKATKLDRYINNLDEIRVDLAYVKSARSATDRQVAQITLRGKGFILRAEERADDIFTAFDSALSKMQRRIERFKGKHFRGRGDGKSVADLVAEKIEEQTEDSAPEIVRRKHFLLHQMDEAEAIEQMSLLGHEDFFVFFNANTNSINVLYKRRDGKFGLIEPEVA